MRTRNKIALIVLTSAAASFGYVRQVTPDAAALPLQRSDNAGMQFLMSDKIAPGMQSSASGKAVTVFAGDPKAAIRASLDTWNGVGTANVKFLPLKTAAAALDPFDNQMVVAVASSPGEVSAVGSALAVTLVVFSPADGRILDTDIILNPGTSFSTDGTTSVDLQSVVTHELGHSLGANHTGLFGASMFQFNSGQRFLTDDDIAFVDATYPKQSGGAALGTLSGTITTTAGAPVPFGLLTIFDSSSGVSIGALTKPDGTYSIQLPPGDYQMYAEPLNGAVAVNVYLSNEQAALAAATKFQPGLFGGTIVVTPGAEATANLAVTPGALMASPSVALVPVGGAVTHAIRGGPLTAASGQAFDMVFLGAGFDATLKDSNFAVFGPGISVRAGSVRIDPGVVLNGIPALRVTLDIAARTIPTLASLMVTTGAGALSFSGAIVIVPPTPTFVSNGVVSAASFLGSNGGGVVSPGGISTIFDIEGSPNLGPATAAFSGPYDAYGNAPTTLGGVTVTFDGVPAALFYSSGSQLNFQVPFEVAGKSSTKVVVNYMGSPSAAVVVPVVAVQPGFFTADGKAVLAYNRCLSAPCDYPDYTLNTAATPAPRGSYVEVYGTGVGQLGNGIKTGSAAPAGFTGSYAYTIGGGSAGTALYGAWTPGFSGLAQWDVQVPGSSATGAVPITVTDSATGASSQPGATIFVK